MTDLISDAQAARNGLMDCTGKEFVQLLFRTCIDAFGNDPEIQVVMSTGGKEDTRPFGFGARHLR